MEIIKLQQDMGKLRGKEKLPKIPELVQCYLDLDEKTRKAKGKYFKIVIDQESKEMSGAGMSYYNALRIKKCVGKSWKQVHSTAMIMYRSGYAHMSDKWCHQMLDPAILEESEEKLIWAIRTGEDKVEVYNLKKAWWPMETFDMRAYNKMKERIESLKGVLNNARNFHTYVSESLSDDWCLGKIDVWEKGCQIFDKFGHKLEGSDYSKIDEKGDIIVLLAEHTDRRFDPITDSYRLFVWVKGKGFGSTGVYKTGLYHPLGRRFYIIGIGIKDINITNFDRSCFILTVKVGNKRQKWEESRDFIVEWNEG